MKAGNKYIIIVCAEPAKTTEAKALLSQLDPFIRIDFVTDPQDLAGLIRRKMPDLIFIHIHNRDNGNMDAIRSIRKDLRGDKIPICKYSTLPKKDEILRMLQLQ